MLILTRKPNQEIQIGPNIYIKVLGVNGKQVRVGLTAPNDINIVRTELLTDEPLKNKS
jgi:carbon storage regulator